MKETSSGQKHFPDVLSIAGVQEVAGAGGKDKRSLFASRFQEIKSVLGQEIGQGVGQEGRKVDMSQMGQSSRLLSGQVVLLTLTFY